MIVIVDLDDTLFVNGNQPVMHVVRAVKQYQDRHTIYIVTARNMRHAALAMVAVMKLGIESEWLFGNGFAGKVDRIKSLPADEILLAIEDNPYITKEYKALGINVVHPDELKGKNASTRF